MYDNPYFETDRLYIKNGTLEDFSKVYEFNLAKLRNVGGVFEYVKYDIEDLKKWFIPNISEYYKNIALKKEFDLIIYKKDGTPVGNLVFDRYREDLNSLEASFNFHPNFWGNGYLKEAIIPVMDYLFNNGISNIMCGYDSGNVKSKRAQEKIGFEPYEIINNSWKMNDICIDTYMSIMTKEHFASLYKNSKSRY